MKTLTLQTCEVMGNLMERLWWTDKARRWRWWSQKDTGVVLPELDVVTPRESEVTAPPEFSVVFGSQISVLAVRMSSGSISGLQTSAAEETESENTIDPQRRLLDFTWKPEIKRVTIGIWDVLTHLFDSCKVLIKALRCIHGWILLIFRWCGTGTIAPWKLKTFNCETGFL